MLVDRAERSGSGPRISFDDAYRDLGALTDLIRSADLVVLPYDSDDQVTSGVLVDAVAAGRPVISTSFPHAVELLASVPALSSDSVIRTRAGDRDQVSVVRSIARRERWRPKRAAWRRISRGPRSLHATTAVGADIAGDLSVRPVPA
jgi:hypothetical protein